MAAELLASLDAPAADEPATVQALWREELERRAKGVLSRDAIGDDWPTVRQRLTDELTG